ncbi:MAG: hypothetical protein AMXMBFR66_08190 [Pseudomonadota bacterium]|nr:class I SAM-dependent methyltransferase [Rubrivivax sp.]
MKQLIKSIPYIRRLHEEIDRQQLELRRWKTWQPPGHFYSPIPALDEVERRAAAIFDTGHARLGGLDLNAERQAELVEVFASLHGDIAFPDGPTPDFRYHFKNEYFSYADGVTLYSMLRHQPPKRIVEVGSGYSSALMLDTNDRHLGHRVAFTFVEPHPERLESLLWEGDRAHATVLRQPVQATPLSVFQELEAGDILFVDSSHVSKTGSDVNFLLFEVLPRLASGVRVHFHDIFYPFEYPKEWVREGVAWNEAYLLRAFLQYNPAFRIEFFVSYVVRHMRERVARSIPLALKSEKDPISFFEDAPGGSLWLVKTGPAT